MKREAKDEKKMFKKMHEIMIKAHEELVKGNIVIVITVVVVLGGSDDDDDCCCYHYYY